MRAEALANLHHPKSSADVARAIREEDFSQARVTLIGFGHMGAEYLKALRELGVSQIRVCARSQATLDGLRDDAGVRLVAGGHKMLTERAGGDDVAIVAVSNDEASGVVDHLLTLGYRTILCEKPISVWSNDLERLERKAGNIGAHVYAAFNRRAYPSLIEAKHRIAAQGGLTSCFYTFTELSKRLNLESYSADEKARWGIANSLHVMSMAHAVAGLPTEVQALRRGALSWHTAGSIFVGAGLSESGVPFSYHADWGSAGRWSVEFFTPNAAYRLCPLEKLYEKTSSLAEWTEVPVVTVSPAVKPGILEQVAALLSDDVKDAVPLAGIGEAIRLTQFGENIFGYGARA